MPPEAVSICQEASLPVRFCALAIGSLAIALDTTAGLHRAGDKCLSGLPGSQPFCRRVDCPRRAVLSIEHYAFHLAFADVVVDSHCAV